jgi:membrane-associated protease RseP (regulator of RpoE activity)
MRKFFGIAAALALASTGIMAATRQPPPRGAADQRAELSGDDVDAWWSDALELAEDQAPQIRRLAVMAGRGAELGVSIRDLDSDQQKSVSGALVEEVRTGSPADKAGIRKGDVITEFDGERVRGQRHLSRLVSETPEGHTVKATVLREGKRVDLSVTPEAGTRAAGRDFDFFVPGPDRIMPGPPREGRRFFSDELPRVEPWRPDGLFVPERGRLGVGIQGLTPQLAEYFGTKDGVLVTHVEPESPAAKAGLKAGDVITTVDGTEIKAPGVLTHAVQRAADGASLALGYVRDKKAATAKATLEASETPKVRQPVRPI